MPVFSICVLQLPCMSHSVSAVSNHQYFWNNNLIKAVVVNMPKIINPLLSTLGLSVSKEDVTYSARLANIQLRKPNVMPSV